MPGSCNDQLQFQPLCSSAGYDATLRSREPGCDVRIKHPSESFLDRFNRQRRRHRLHGGTLPGRGLLEFRTNIHADCTTFNNMGLTASTSYSYRVRATDAASNLSAYSSTASAGTPAPPDTT